MAAGVTEVFANTASTTLNNGGTLTAGATSCTVTSGAVFPSTGNFRILIESEIILVTARATNVLTLVRGQEGTSAASHADGLVVTHVLTKGAIQALQQTRPVFTNTASATYTMDSTGNPFDVLILHNKSGAVSYVMPAPTAGRHIEVYDVTGAINTLANNIFFVPSASEKFNASSGFAMTGTAYHFTNGNGTVTATGSKFQSELAVGMSIQSSNQAGVNYIVTAIASDLSLTISPTFGGTTTTTATATRTSLTFAANSGKLFFDSDGTDWYITGDGTPTILKYTASSGGTVAPFIPPQGVTTAQFRGAGGGGGGGGGTGNNLRTGGAGGGAALQSYEEVSVTPMTNYAVTIGAGGSLGAGGSSGGGASGNGGSGGDTTVGNLVTFCGASGGAGGSTTTTNDAGGGLCVKASDGTNLYNQVDTSTLLANSTSFFMSIAGGGASASTNLAGVGGSRNIVGGFAGGASGGASGGSGGGGGAGPRGNGGAGGAGGSGGTGGSPSNNTGAGAGGGGGASTGVAGGNGGVGGSGYVDIIYVL